MRKWLIVAVVSILILILISGCTKPTGGVKAADFYKGSTVTQVVPYSAGGGTDSLGRVFARYLAANIGANVVVDNKPGGGGLEGPNYMYNTAKKDGSVICYDESGGGSWGSQIRKDAGVQYDMNKFEYIGSMASSEGALWVKADGPYKTMKDLQSAKGLRFATLAPGSGQAMGCALAIEALKLDAKIVTGLKGRADVVLALQKGEADCAVSPIPGMETYLEKKDLRVLCIVGIKPTDLDKKWGAAAITDVATISNDMKTLIALYESSPDTKTIFTPPGTPKDRVEFLRTAFVDICKLPDFQKDTTTYFSIWPGYATGEATTKEAQRRYNSAADFQKIIDLVAKYKA